MRIAFVEIANFRKLESVRVDLARETTLFVGANNSGKTSALLALRRFLVDGGKFSTNDFTLSHWRAINAIGSNWEVGRDAAPPHSPQANDWNGLLPTLDIWLHVDDGEVHHVSTVIPTLDWNGGLLGVRLRFEPKNVDELYQDYQAAITDVSAVKTAAAKGGGQGAASLTLWPESMIAFLERRLRTHFTVRTYALDPSKCQNPEKGLARPQVLSGEAAPIEGDPIPRLIRIDEINTQRGFGHENDGADGAEPGVGRDRRRLSDQLRSYYAKHLDPSDRPDAADLDALQAIELAQKAFDDKLETHFRTALSEVHGLGYPGVTDPRLKISTRLRPTDGLDHDAAVQYEIDVVTGAGKAPTLRLPEDYNGLGYQNLISMVFNLMSFRDAWMRVGKAGKGPAGREESIEPVHLVLVEEPEAHLHAQVQQVFIKKAYSILRAHADLLGNGRLTTQLVVSTHSSHVAHETPFACLRYFRRLPAGMASNVPVSTVVNLSEVFGEQDETQRFVTRYLRAQHCDLFFADAAILVEGPAERMLVPHFMRTHFKFLNQCYITLLEIGGSHAHRLEPLIRHLGLLTLVVTDLDAGRAADGVAEQPMRAQNQVTNNTTLRQWVPRLNGIDDLLEAKPEAKGITYDPLFAVRVAYQTAIAIQAGDGGTVEALANTFEDALVFENMEFFSTLDGHGLVAKFRDAIQASKDPAILGASLFASLRNAKKAEFALDVIDAQSFEQLRVPGYIAEGLRWLEKQLRKKQVEVLPETTIKGGTA